MFNIELFPGESETVLYKYDLLGEDFSYDLSIRNQLEPFDKEKGKIVADLGEPSYRNDLMPQKFSVEEVRAHHEGNFEEILGDVKNLKFTNVDLIRFLEEKTEKVKRVWDGEVRALL